MDPAARDAGDSAGGWPPICCMTMRIRQPSRRSSPTPFVLSSTTPGHFAQSLSPHSGRFGLRRNDGLALLQWLLDLVGDKETPQWMRQARESMMRRNADQAPAASLPRPGSPA